MRVVLFESRADYLRMWNTRSSSIYLKICLTVAERVRVSEVCLWRFWGTFGKLHSRVERLRKQIRSHGGSFRPRDQTRGNGGVWSLLLSPPLNGGYESGILRIDYSVYAVERRWSIAATRSLSRSHSTYITLHPESLFIDRCAGNVVEST